MRRLVWFSLCLAACSGGTDTIDAGPTDLGVVDTGVDGPDGDNDLWTDDIDNCPALANPEQRDRDQDGLGDACDTCPATPNNGEGDQVGQDACEVEMEVEPNNTDAEAQAVTLVPQGALREIRGVLEAPRSGQQSVDRYQFMLPARSLLKVRVARAAPTSRLEPLIFVNGGGFTVERQAEGLFTAEREIYAAEAGTYEILVTDRRGARGGTPQGDNDWDYALAVEVISAVPLVRNLPVNAEPFDIEGKIPLIETMLDVSEFSRFATEIDDSFAIDPILVVEREDGTVIENDNLADGFTEARVILEIDRPEMVRVALDHRRWAPDGPAEVRLTLDQPDLTQELEPNDTAELASELVFPGETRGFIKEPTADAPDVDWYALEATAGRILAITGLSSADSRANVAIQLFQSRLAPVEELELLYASDDSSGTSPRIEAILPEDGLYLLRVEDETNRMAPFEGGTLWSYGLFSEPTGIQPSLEIITSATTAPDMTGVLDPGGRVGRHLVVTDEPTLLMFDRLSTGPDLEAHVRVYGPSAIGVLGESGEERTYAYANSANSFIGAVHNSDAGAGGPLFTYQYRVRYEPLSARAEVEPNDDGEAASLPAIITGRIASDQDSDSFTITVTPPGMDPLPVDAVLTQGWRGAQVELLDDQGTVIELGTGALRSVPLDAGTYTVRVSATVGRDYTLVIHEGL